MWLRVQQLCGTTNTDKCSRITLIKKLWGDCHAWAEVLQIWPTSFLRPVCMCARVFVCVREVCCCVVFFSFPQIQPSAVGFPLSSSLPLRLSLPAFRTKAQLCVFTSCVQLSVFIYYAVWKPQKQWVTLDVGIWKSPLTYQPDQREQAWRFVSYMFVHAGWAAPASGDGSTCWMVVKVISVVLWGSSTAPTAEPAAMLFGFSDLTPQFLGLSDLC